MKFLLRLCFLVPVILAQNVDQDLNELLWSGFFDLHQQLNSKPEVDVTLAVTQVNPVKFKDIYKERIYEKDVANFVYSIKNPEISGLANFNVISIDSKMATKKVLVALFVPILEIDGTYELSGRIHDDHLETSARGVIEGGRGKNQYHFARVSLLDVDVSLELELKEENGAFSIGKVDTKLKSVLRKRVSSAKLKEWKVKDYLIQKVYELLRPSFLARFNSAVSNVLGCHLHKVKVGQLPNSLSLSSFARSNNWQDDTAGSYFIDDLLLQARPQIEETLEPVILPKGRLGFSQKVLLVTVSGEVKIFDGWLAGVGTVHRTSRAEVTKSPDGRVVAIRAHLGVSNLLGHYQGRVKFMSIGPTVEVHITLAAISIDVTLVQNVRSVAPAALKVFKIEQVGSIVVDFDGLGPLDWIINPFTNYVVNLVKGIIIWVVETPLKDMVVSQLNEIQPPNFRGR